MHVCVHECMYLCVDGENGHQINFQDKICNNWHPLHCLKIKRTKLIEGSTILQYFRHQDLPKKSDQVWRRFLGTKVK